MIQIKRFCHLRMPRGTWGHQNLLQDQEQNGADKWKRKQDNWGVGCKYKRGCTHSKEDENDFDHDQYHHQYWHNYLLCLLSMFCNKCHQLIKLYSVSGRWMNEHAELLEWYWQGKAKFLEKNLSSATLSTTNIAWTGLGLNLHLCNERLKTNHHCMS